MFKSFKLYSLIILLAFPLIVINFNKNSATDDLPLVAIANYGPHPSLFETINGLKNLLKENGYEEGKNIRYEILNVNFDTALIIQMLTKLKASKPKVIVAISTPVAQSAKNMIKDIPVVFADVTDPISAGLIDHAQTNITGASDKQDLKIMLKFTKQLIPNIKKLGVLYSTGEANDIAMIRMLQQAAKEQDIEIMAIPVEHAREVTTRMRSFNNKIDAIYTGSSGAIQSALPAIAAAADDMKIPVINFNQDEVINHMVLASYGVSHKRVGANAGKIVLQILQGIEPTKIGVTYPSSEDHIAYISKKKAEQLCIIIPASLSNVEVAE